MKFMDSAAQGDLRPGTLPPDGTSGGTMAQEVSEAALYCQLTHFSRLLDAGRAIAALPSPEMQAAANARLAPVRAVLDAGCHAVQVMPCSRHDLIIEPACLWLDYSILM